MLKTSVERLEGIAVRLTVTVPSTEVDAAIARAYKAIAAKVRVPGFRPGKAPHAVLDSMMGRESILAEATEDVVNTTYPKALDIEELRPIESPELDELDTVEPGVEYTYSAQIDVRPELTLSSIADLSVTLPEREATDFDVEEQIDMMRERFASVELVEGRGAQADDYVLLSFSGLVDGEPYEGNQVDKYLYEMSRGLMPQEFDEGIVGMKAGDETTVEFLIPETSSNAEFAGKTATFSVTVHEVKAKVLPAVDEEFATNVGGFESVEELQADIRNRIGVQKGIAYGRLKENRVRAAVAERLEGDVPEAIVVGRQAAMVRDFMNMLENQEMMIDRYLAQVGMDMDTFEADMARQATQSVKEDLALEALFRALELEITDEDIDTELAEVGQATDASPEDTRARWEEMGLMAVLREQIMHRKAVFWLLDNVEVVDEAPETTEE